MANKYVVLLRGINVGGKNKVPMAQLRECLVGLGYDDVGTYIQSGNALLRSRKSAPRVRAEIEGELPRYFSLDSVLLKVRVLTPSDLVAVVDSAPDGFGSRPNEERYDVAFLMDATVDEAMPQFSVNPQVDAVWPGPEVVYYRRLIEGASRSRLSAIVQRPIYQNMTIRNWRTTLTLRDMAKA